MNTNALATAIAAKAAAIATMRGTSATVPDTIPATPWAVVGPHSATYDAGPMDKIRYTFPIRCYVQRTSSAERVQVAANDLVDAFVAAYRNGLTYGGTVAVGRIQSWDTDLYAEIGEAAYQVIEFSLFVLVLDTTGHTP
jgi:hypothetical protein